MDYIDLLIDQYNIPLLTAFLTGILTSISPCPLATNVTAIAYISKDIKTPKKTLLNGLYYTIGRSFSYTVLASLIYLGFSSFEVSRIFQGWGEKVLGPILILIGLIMFDVIKLTIKTKNEKIERLKEKLATKGYLGSFLLGCLFALAFCPYSGVLFFGVLVPLVLSSTEALLLPPLFGIGTGLPVIVFSFLIAFSMKKVGQAFQIVQKIEKVSRKLVASVFILTGVYYLQFLIKFLLKI
ncbi:MAG TPA: aromatic aminobenezylarsenical efflux permease ArsG family transporter [Candidatus Bathyarchaeia archaeon]|nr:aromatic aminobenezylarsenical efflux permease ArsG family transporter [Candidatus Bathyarchaeia archaeon]